jgi:hypothetical protein
MRRARTRSATAATRSPDTHSHIPRRQNGDFLVRLVQIPLHHTHKCLPLLLSLSEARLMSAKPLAIVAFWNLEVLEKVESVLRYASGGHCAY